MIRGLDYVVERFSPLLNRNFVFFEPGGDLLEPEVVDQRERWFRALRREHVLLSNLPRDSRRPVVVERAAALAVQLEATPAAAPSAPGLRTSRASPNWKQ